MKTWQTTACNTVNLNSNQTKNTKKISSSTAIATENAGRAVSLYETKLEQDDHIVRQTTGQPNLLFRLSRIQLLNLKYITLDITSENTFTLSIRG